MAERAAPRGSIVRRLAETLSIEELEAEVSRPRPPSARSISGGSSSNSLSLSLSLSLCVCVRSGVWGRKEGVVGAVDAADCVRALGLCAYDI